MRTCKDQAVFLMMMQDVSVFPHVLIKGKLQDFHGGKIKSSQQLIHLIIHHPQILRNERHGWKLPFRQLEKLFAWTSYPFAIDSRFFRRRHFPKSRKSPEMVQADEIIKPQVLA